MLKKLKVIFIIFLFLTITLEYINSTGCTPPYILPWGEVIDFIYVPKNSEDIEKYINSPYLSRPVNGEREIPMMFSSLEEYPKELQDRLFRPFNEVVVNTFECIRSK